MIVYLAAVLPFVIYVNQRGFPLTSNNLAFMAGEFAVSLQDSKIRGFHAGLNHFFPFLDHTRVTAELKGIEKSTPSSPTTPFTLQMLVAFAYFVRMTFGMPQMTGILCAFDGLMRSIELLKVRAIDVILRNNTTVRQTSIRLGTTKNNREQVVFLPPNSLAERALFRLLRATHSRYGPLFEIGSYRELYDMIIKFKERFAILIHLTPHSLRAGGATNMRAAGHTFMQILEQGRWECIKSCKQYIDVIFNLMPETIALHERIHPTMPRALEGFLFPRTPV